jgi:hypothetical protein
MSEALLGRAKKIAIQSIRRKFESLEKLYAQKHILQKNIFRQRVQALLGGFHALYNIRELPTLEAIITYDMIARQISFSELQPREMKLLDDPLRYQEAIHILEKTKFQRREFLTQFPDKVGSPHVHITLHHLRTRHQKRQRVATINARFENVTEADPIVEQKQIQRLPFKDIPFPFTEEELKLLEANEIVEGPVPFTIYEDYLYRMVQSKGNDHAQLKYVLQQALTAKMLLQTRRRHACVYFPWVFPTLLSITQVGYINYGSIPFVPVDFYGSYTTPLSLFATCVFEVDDRIHEDIKLEFVLLIKTSCFAELAQEALREFLLTRPVAAITEVSENIGDILEYVNDQRVLSRIKGMYRKQLSMDQAYDRLDRMKRSMDRSVKTFDRIIGNT